MNVELKKCPFCGGTPALDAKPHDATELAHYVRCLCCGAEGPWMKTEGNAIRLWNMRQPEKREATSGEAEVFTRRSEESRSVSGDSAPDDAGATATRKVPKSNGNGEQPDWLYRISYGLSEARHIRILIDGSQFAVVQCPGGKWYDNSGGHYGKTTYYLVDKLDKTVADSSGLIHCRELQNGGRAKLAQWKKTVEQSDSVGKIFNGK